MRETVAVETEITGFRMQDQIVTKTKRMVIVTKVKIDQPERFKRFEIRLPSNVTKVTGVLVTASLNQLPVP